jgi:hypothetical protein
MEVQLSSRRGELHRSRNSPRRSNGHPSVQMVGAANWNRALSSLSFGCRPGFKPVPQRFQLLCALDLLDFGRVAFVRFRHSRAFCRAPNFVRVLDFCWISRRVERMFASSMTRKHLLTCEFVEWAVLGSNQRPLRCKGHSPKFPELQKRSFSQFRAASRVVSFNLS